MGCGRETVEFEWVVVSAGVEILDHEISHVYQMYFASARDDVCMFLCGAIQPLSSNKVSRAFDTAASCKLAHCTCLM